MECFHSMAVVVVVDNKPFGFLIWKQLADKRFMETMSGCWIVSVKYSSEESIDVLLCVMYKTQMFAYLQEMKTKENKRKRCSVYSDKIHYLYGCANTRVATCRTQKLDIYENPLKYTRTNEE